MLSQGRGRPAKGALKRMLSRHAAPGLDAMIRVAVSHEEVIREREVSRVDVGERGQSDRRITSRPVHIKAH